jgi:hypothetical protein
MRLISSALAVILTWATPLSAQEFPTTRQLRALSPAKADKQARKDLLSILKPMKTYSVGNRLALGDIWFTTKPYATAIPGICARDLLSLFYHVTEKVDGRFADTPVRPYRVEAKTGYTFVRKPSAKMLKREDEDRLPFQDECARASNDDFGEWWEAEAPDTGVRAYLAFEAALVRLKAGTLSADECDVQDRDKGSRTANCLADLEIHNSPERLYSVGACDAPDGQLCYGFGLSPQVTIRLKRPARDMMIRQNPKTSSPSRLSRSSS